MPENWVVLNLEQLKSSRMQDMHGIGEGSGGGGGGGRFLGVGDRRLRPLSHQAVKCPRCDSINTKFCYYNNYNLSQPRHFCKSCRRYWTKGGVLRNVPVGGGCRKAKRSKQRSHASSSADDAAAPGEFKSSAQSSSSESSSLTTAAATAAPPPPPASASASAAAAEEGSATIYAAPDSAVMYNFADASFSNVIPLPNPNPDRQPLSDNHAPSDGQIFPAEMGSFTELMPSEEEELMMRIDVATTTSYGREQAPTAEDQPSAAEDVDELKMEEISHDDGLAAGLDWGSGGGGGGGDGGDQGLFDLTAGVDPAYWSQSDWTDNDQSLNYLP